MKNKIEEIRESLFNKGYILITDKYKNNVQKLEFVCPNGHYSSISGKRGLKGARCKFCTGYTPIIQGRKQCNICKKGKSIKKFVIRKSDSDYFGISNECNVCKPKLKQNVLENGKKDLIIKIYDERYNKNSYIPKVPIIKILMKCQLCDDKIFTNAFKLYENNYFYCKKCIGKIMWNNDEKRKNMLKNRSGIEYRKKLSKSIKQSYKDNPDRIREISKRNVIMHEKKRGFGVELLDEWYLYKKRAHCEMERVYKKYKNIINPYNLERGRGKDKYHIDHVFSILDGFKNNVPIYIISHYSNLHMMLERDNLKKDCKSEININELYEKWEESYRVAKFI